MPLTRPRTLEMCHPIFHETSRSDHDCPGGYDENDKREPTTFPSPSSFIQDIIRNSRTVVVYKLWLRKIRKHPSFWTLKHLPVPSLPSKRNFLRYIPMYRRCSPAHNPQLQIYSSSSLHLPSCYNLPLPLFDIRGRYETTDTGNFIKAGVRRITHPSK